MEKKHLEMETHIQLKGKQKKKLFSKLQSQMEFYFSDSNLAKDRFVKSLIEESCDGFIDLEVFKSFNKIKALTEDVNIIAEALSKSKILEVSSDMRRVKRLTPIKCKDFETCTIYVEKVPPHADQKWARDVFKQFGEVSYVSIPRFKPSGKIKGFAFVEFEEKDSVVKACEFYKILSENESSGSEQEITVEEDEPNNEDTNGRKRKHSDMMAEEDALVKNEESETQKPGENPEDPEKMERDESIHEDTKSRKRKHSNVIDHVSEKEEEYKKQKFQDSEIKFDNQLENKTNIIESDSTKQDAVLNRSDCDEKKTEIENENMCVDDTPGKGKRKRKHKKKKCSKSGRPQLRIMPKSEWRMYRNKYLDLQRATMSHIKKRVLMESYALKPNEKIAKSDKLPFSPKKASQFTPGVILKVILSEPVQSTTAFKESVKGLVNVAYIDAPLGFSEAFMRCHSAEDAMAITRDQKLAKIGAVEVMIGSEEEEYWKKIESDRKTKYSTPLIRTKRGRDKIIAKAQKTAEQKNKHIFFEE